MDKRSAVLRLLLVVGLLSGSAWSQAQTTSGSSATIVVPVIAQTASFGSEVTAYNPNAGAITVNVSFYDAQNTANPGAKACTPLGIGAGASVEFSLAGQCALPTGGNFGLLVLAEATGTQRFYGYARTQNPQGIGFSTEGFPIENFNDQLQHATGLKRVAASGGLPAYQTNCFVASLGDAVSYQLQLYNGASGTQIGSTLSGSLQPWQQYRYLDVFSAVGAPSGDVTDVRAQFTNLTGTNKKLIGFCTVQDNTSFSADFRIAKSYGGTPQNAFVQGGNAFGTTALLGTVDNQPLSVLANGQAVARYLPTVDAFSNFEVNVVAGYPSNNVSSTAWSQTIAGGGYVGSSCYDPPSNTNTRSCGNRTSGSYATIGGGLANLAANTADMVAGGQGNTASGGFSTVAGGADNIASGTGSTVAGGESNSATATMGTVGGGYVNMASGDYATVAGGFGNWATGPSSTVAGGQSNVATGGDSAVLGGLANDAQGTYSIAMGSNAWADQSSCAVIALWSTTTTMDCLGASNIVKVGADHGFSVDYSSQRTDGGGTRWVAIGDTSPGATIVTWNGAYLSDGGAWTNASDRALKTDFTRIDPQQVLAKVVAMPVTTWRYKSESYQRHLGPVAQDFYAAFHLGADDKHITTIDEGGVALAAIKGLDQQEQQDRARFQRLLQEKDAQIDAQQHEIRALNERMASFEAMRDDIAQLKAALAELQRTRMVTAAR